MPHETNPATRKRRTFVVAGLPAVRGDGLDLGAGRFPRRSATVSAWIRDKAGQRRDRGSPRIGTAADPRGNNTSAQRRVPSTQHIFFFVVDGICFVLVNI
ncbi:MAG: hypothetical protein ACJ8AD_03800, partial [Gemmatimonadaceae bacterium]